MATPPRPTTAPHTPDKMVAATDKLVAATKSNGDDPTPKPKRSAATAKGPAQATPQPAAPKAQEPPPPPAPVIFDTRIGDRTLNGTTLASLLAGQTLAMDPKEVEAKDTGKSTELHPGLNFVKAAEETDDNSEEDGEEEEEGDGGVKYPAGLSGKPVFVFNDGEDSSISVYPPEGGKFAGMDDGKPFDLDANECALLYSRDGQKVFVILG